MLVSPLDNNDKIRIVCELMSRNLVVTFHKMQKATNIECADDKRLRNYNRFTIANIGLEF